MRFAALALALALFTAALVAALLTGAAPWIVVAAVLAVPVLAGAYDLAQRRHSVLRNYPIIGHARFALEKVRPELQQYFIERNYDGRPYDRDTRTAIYERAKGLKDEQAYGTERDVAEPGYEWLLHSAAPVEPAHDA
ncbi:MAG TPA: FMN-binding glutamate synthase family protein, partial [Baekduia sp.]